MHKYIFYVNNNETPGFEEKKLKSLEASGWLQPDDKITFIRHSGENCIQDLGKE